MPTPSLWPSIVKKLSATYLGPQPKVQCVRRKMIVRAYQKRMTALIRRDKPKSYPIINKSIQKMKYTSVFMYNWNLSVFSPFLIAALIFGVIHKAFGEGRFESPMDITKRALLARYKNAVSGEVYLVKYSKPQEVRTIRQYLDPSLFEILSERAVLLTKIYRDFAQLSNEDQLELASMLGPNIFSGVIALSGSESYIEQIGGERAEVVMQGVYLVDGGERQKQQVVFEYTRRRKSWILANVRKSTSLPVTGRTVNLDLRVTLRREIATLREIGSRAVKK